MKKVTNLSCWFTKFKKFYDKAKFHLERSLELNKGNLRSLNNMGNYYRKIGNLEKAIEFYQKIESKGKKLSLSINLKNFLFQK